MTTRIPAALLLLVLVASACADAPTEPGDGSASADGGLVHPSGAADLLLRVSFEGGFVPVEYHLTAAPTFSLFGDGTVVTQGAQIEIYPGPALPPLIATPLTERGVESLLRDAIATGLDEEHEYTDLGSVGVADASTTVFTLTVDGEARVTKVYALGILGGERPEGMSQAEYDARARLERFQAELQDLRATLPEGSVGEDTPYTPTGLRLFIREYRPDPELEQRSERWPLDTPLSSLGEPTDVAGYSCAVVDGADLEAVLPLAQAANQLTPWSSEGERYGIVFRPLLPDESGC
jgi:hypothetical protein